MRKEPLSGYILHSRPYQEKRAIYRFFCQQNGMVDGVGRQGLLPFTPLTAFASGRSTLKTFSQCQYLHHHHRFMGVGYYGGLYMNELLFRLVAIHDPAPQLFDAYAYALAQLSTGLDDVNALKKQLRLFEVALLDELGASLDVSFDDKGAAINAQTRYAFFPTQGFVVDTLGEYMGADIIALKDKSLSLFDDKHYLALIGKLHRLVIDHLLGYKPLNSRRLWQDKSHFGAKK